MLQTKSHPKLGHPAEKVREAEHRETNRAKQEAQWGGGYVRRGRSRRKQRKYVPSESDLL